MMSLLHSSFSFDIRTGVGEFCEHAHVLHSNSVIGLSFTHSAFRITFTGVILATLLYTPNMFQWHRGSEASIATHTCSFQLFMEMRTSSYTKTRTVELSCVQGTDLITAVWIRGWRCRHCVPREGTEGEAVRTASVQKVHNRAR